MSTVMYAFRVKKSDWPALMVNLRKWGATKSALAQLELEPEIKGNGWSDRIDMVDNAQRAGGRDWETWTDMSVEVQVFDRGPYYLLRPLEKTVVWPPGPGWNDSYYNKLGEYLMRHRSTRLVRYDNRVDVPPKERRNAEIAKWLDQQITAGMFMVFSVVSLHDYKMRLYRRCWDRADGVT